MCPAGGAATGLRTAGCCRRNGNSLAVPSKTKRLLICSFEKAPEEQFGEPVLGHWTTKKILFKLIIYHFCNFWNFTIGPPSHVPQDFHTCSRILAGATEGELQTKRLLLFLLILLIVIGPSSTWGRCNLRA